MASSVQTTRQIFLNENDIPGASLLGRKPEELKNDELKFWLKCRGDSAKGLKTKAQLVKRYEASSVSYTTMVAEGRILKRKLMLLFFL